MQMVTLSQVTTSSTPEDLKTLSNNLTGFLAKTFFLSGRQNMNTCLVLHHGLLNKSPKPHVLMEMEVDWSRVSLLARKLITCPVAVDKMACKHTVGTNVMLPLTLTPCWHVLYSFTVHVSLLMVSFSPFGVLLVQCESFSCCQSDSNPPSKQRFWHFPPIVPFIIETITVVKYNTKIQCTPKMHTDILTAGVDGAAKDELLAAVWSFSQTLFRICCISSLQFLSHLLPHVLLYFEDQRNI